MQSSTWNNTELTATGALYCDYPTRKPYRLTPKSSPTSSGGLSDSETGNNNRQYLPDSCAESEQESLYRLASLLHRNTRSTHTTIDSNGQYDISFVPNPLSTPVWIDQLYNRPQGGTEQHSTYGSSSSLSRDENWTRSHSSGNLHSYLTSYPAHHQPPQRVDNLGSSRLVVASDSNDFRTLSLLSKPTADVCFDGDSFNYSQFTQRCHKFPNRMKASSPPMVHAPYCGSRTNRYDVSSVTNRDFAINEISGQRQLSDDSRCMQSMQTAPTSSWSLVFDTPPSQAHANVAWPLPPSPTSYVRYPINSNGGLDAIAVSSSPLESHHEDGASFGCQPIAVNECVQRPSSQQHWTSPVGDTDHSTVPVKVTPSTAIGKP